MGDLSLSKILEIEEGVTKEDIIHKIEDALKRNFDKASVLVKDGSHDVKCRVKTKLWNPIVSLKGPLQVQVKGNKAKVMIDGETKTNGWFWFTLILGFGMPLLWIAMFFMHSGQTKKSQESLRAVFNKLEFDVGSF